MVKNTGPDKEAEMKSVKHELYALRTQAMVLVARYTGDPLYWRVCYQVDQNMSLPFYRIQRLVMDQLWRPK